MVGRSLWRFGGGETIRSGQSEGLGESEVLSQTQVLGTSQNDELTNWKFAVEFAKKLAAAGLGSHIRAKP